MALIQCLFKRIKTIKHRYCTFKNSIILCKVFVIYYVLYPSNIRRSHWHCLLYSYDALAAARSYSKSIVKGIISFLQYKVINIKNKNNFFRLFISHNWKKNGYLKKTSLKKKQMVFKETKKKWGQGVIVFGHGTQEDWLLNQKPVIKHYKFSYR